MTSIMTGNQLAETPREDRVYTCQQCGKTEQGDGADFRLIAFAGLAYAMCLDCLVGPEMIVAERKQAAEGAWSAAILALAAGATLDDLRASNYRMPAREVVGRGKRS